jgi:predicted membrane GTPase involved in stress response
MVKDEHGHDVPAEGEEETNVRAANKDEKSVVAPPREMTLERSLEWINDDEVVEAFLPYKTKLIF